jgi:hypothetical protein
MADLANDPVVFAEQALGLEVYGHQAQALRATAPVVVAAGGRRSGKSAASQMKALHCCFKRRNAQWLAISTNEGKVKEYLRECVDLLRGSRQAQGSLLDEQSMRLTFSNGSAIIGVLATSGQVRGYGRHVFGATVDEAGFQPERLWRDLRYVMLDHRDDGAQVWMIGTPWGSGDHFFRASWLLGESGDPDYVSFRWPTSLNPRVPADWIGRERDRIAPSEAAAELDGEWSDAAGSLFSRSLLERQTADYECGDLGSLQLGPRLAVGCDWGVSFDRSAVVALGRLPIVDLNVGLRGPVFGVAAVQVWPAGAMLSDVWTEIAAADVSLACVSSEVNGVGAGPTQELRRMLGERTHSELAGALQQGALPTAVHWFLSVTTTARSKTDAYGRLLWLLEQGRLILPRHPDLLRQLAGLRFEQGARGFTHIEAEDAAVHDDVADALMLATGPYVADGAQYSYLAIRARGSDDRPDTEVVLPADVEMVATPAGTVLPVRPVWQSVDGPEISGLPAVDQWADFRKKVAANA